MKRLLLIIILSLSALTSLQAQRTVYDRYAGRRDITVAYIYGFDLGNGQRVAVTTIVARNDRGWRWMVTEFGIPMPDIDNQEALLREEEVVSTWLSVKGEPSKRIENGGDCDLVATSYAERTLCVFHIANKEQFDILFNKILDRL